MSPSKRPSGDRDKQVDEHFRSRPEVILEFIFDKGLLFVCVRNIGDRPALKISVKFNQRIMGQAGYKDVSALPLFKNIEFLGPQREIASFVDSSSSYFSRKQPTKISARLTYSDPEQRKYEATINHDLEIYRTLAYVKERHDEPDCL